MTFPKKITIGVMGLAVLGTLVSCSTTKQAGTNPAHVVEATNTVPEQVVAFENDDEYGRTPAAECNSSKYKSCKDARRNDTADRYFLGHDGTLYRKINKAVCAITSGVQDFKISQHPNDIAVVYYRKNGDLYLINLDRELRTRGNCPSAKGNTKLLMSRVSKYTVTSNINTTIVNAALDVNGLLYAWDDRRVVYRDSNISEFQMNECYSVKSKSFSSFVLFTRDLSNQITKVRVREGYFVKDDSKSTQERYNKISEFKEQNNVCE